MGELVLASFCFFEPNLLKRIHLLYLRVLKECMGIVYGV